MGEYKTPGIYIKEKNAFGNSVVVAETAIPVFIGLTEKAQNGTESLKNKPVRISSMTEYEQYFGGAQIHSFDISVADVNENSTILSVSYGEKKLQATLTNKHCTLYYHLQLFFANGGDTCYIVSVGDYATGTLDKDTVNHTVLPALNKEAEITLLVIPEAVETEEYADFYTAMLSHCAANNRFTILDLPYDGKAEDFRANVGNNFLAYGAAYYPWLNTTVLSENDIDGEMMKLNISQDFKTGIDQLDAYIRREIEEIKKNGSDGPLHRNNLHKALMLYLPEYRLLAKKVKDYLNQLPPSAAMAGLYTMVDHTRGVWKAPANVSVNYVSMPSVNITDREQEDYNMPMDGKAINIIRAFPGEGSKVWGARTLDGNSQDWRYINVRRTMNFLEISVKNAVRAYVFEPNDANTWMNMKCMIEDFLRSIWKRGGLAGYTPEEAFEVHVGFGDTMTGNDILEGILRVSVLVAISRPAEFIEITFQQQMQKS